MLNVGLVGLGTWDGAGWVVVEPHLRRVGSQKVGVEVGGRQPQTLSDGCEEEEGHPFHGRVPTLQCISEPGGVGGEPVPPVHGAVIRMVVG